MAFPFWLVVFVVYASIVQAVYLSRPVIGFWIYFGFSTVGGLLLAMLDMYAFPPVILVALFITIGQWKKWKLRTTLACSMAVTVLSCLIGLPRTIEVSELLAATQPVSLEQRMVRKSSQPSIDQVVGTPEIEASLVDVENMLKTYQRATRPHFRDRVLPGLVRMHQSSLKIFVDLPGTGSSRIAHLPIRKTFIELSAIDPIPFGQEVDPLDLQASKDWAQDFPQEIVNRDFLKGHEISIANFANPNGFGHSLEWDRNSTNLRIKPKPAIKNVYGFQAHGFRRVPELAINMEADDTYSLFRNRTYQPPPNADSTTWLVERLDLVSIWLNDPPAVYITENLPNMEELGGSATRPLTRFESEALNELRQGKMLSVRSTFDTIWIMGAVRASQSCLNCHEAEKGELLGAFSYILLRR